jgi:Pyruvate/2-oxoacid:ferredoxin oxidoreductase delta subunit
MELLLDLAEVVADASMCGLGQSAANPVLSTIRYFAHEYKAHIEEKKCVAGVCKDLLSYLILAEYCKGCGVCAKDCPVSAISGEKGQLHVIDTRVCQKCGICLESCKFSAVLLS